jgi:serine protease Do
MSVSKKWLSVVAAGVAGGLFWAVQSWTAAAPAVDEREAETAIARAEDLSAGFRHVAKKTVPAVVSIRTARKIESPRMTRIEDPFGMDGDSPFRGSPFEDLFRQFEQQRGMPQGEDAIATGEGSGFVFDPAGRIMTNAHVVRGADEVTVTLADGREFPATDIRTDDFSDVAVLTIDTGESLPALKLGDDATTQIGDWVLAIGSPFGLEMSVTQGIISAKSRGLKPLALRQEFLQTDAAVNPGNSGGPLVNLRGEVIGINTAIETRSGGYDGVSFAVPVSLARWVSDELIAHGKVRRAYLGVRPQDIDPEVARALELKSRQGVVVAEVTTGSPADQAGVQVRDVIVSLAGRPVMNRPQLISVAERMTIGESYPLVVMRDGEEIELSVTAAEFPEQAVAATDEPGSDGGESVIDSLGIEARSLTPELAREFELDLESGVVVTRVNRGGVAARFGIQPGHVITRIGRTDVQSIDDLQQGLEAARERGQLVIEVRTSNGTQLLSVPFR